MSLGAFEALESLLRKRQEKSYAQLNRIARHQLREATNPNKLVPNVDLSENRECIRVMVDLPGVLAKDIDVTIDNGVLCIEGSRKIMDPNDTVCVKKQRFIRRYAIDTDVVDCDDATAVLSNGVLTFKAPKKPRKQVVRVPVTEASSGPQEHDVADDAETEETSLLSPSEPSSSTCAKPPPEISLSSSPTADTHSSEPKGLDTGTEQDNASLQVDEESVARE